MDYWTVGLIAAVIILGLIVVIQFGAIVSLQDENTETRQDNKRLREERDAATEEVQRLALAAVRKSEGERQIPVRRYRNKLREAEEGRR
jgi:hypothetical protein